MGEQETRRIVQERWLEISQYIRQDSHERYKWLAPLVDALSKHPRISKLFPYTSLNTLCLSRTTRDSWSGDCPRIDAIAENVFRVYGTHGVLVFKIHGEYRWRDVEYEILGEGSVDEAAAWIDAAIPPEREFVIDGNFDDLRRAEGKSVTAPETRELQIAVLRGRIPEITALLAAGADINGVEYGGCTALMMSVYSPDEQVVQFLLDAGADVNARTDDGETALSIATFENKHPAIIQILKDRGGVE